MAGGGRWDRPEDTELIDAADFPLASFYKVQSVIAPRIFTTQTPASAIAASPGYEVATQFSPAVNGTVKALRFYRPSGETGNNTLRLWTNTGTQLASATWVDNGTSGWKEVSIGGGARLAAGTLYRVSVNTNTVQSKTAGGFSSPIVNGPLTAYQGYWGQPMESMPANASSGNYFADVVFEPGTEIFTSQTPATFPSAVPGYEVGTQFSSSVNGTVKGLRFYRAPGETGDNILRLWSNTGTLLASGRFADNGSNASGWQEVAIGGVPITADPLPRFGQHQHRAEQDQLRPLSGDHQRPLDRRAGLLGNRPRQHAGQRELQQLLRRPSPDLVTGQPGARRASSRRAPGGPGRGGHL